MAVNHPQIGDEQFLVLRGPLNFMGEGVEIHSWPGVDGIGAWLLGDRSEPFQVRTVRDVESSADAKERIRQYELLKGTLVTLELYTGRTFTNMLVVDVGQYRIREVKTFAGPKISANAAAGVLEATWTLQATEIIPAPE